MVAQIRLRDAGGNLRTVARIRARDASGELRTIQRIRIRDASNVLRTVWYALTALISPSPINGSYRGSSASPQDIATSSVIAAVSGGIPSYSYAWAQVGVSAYSWTIGTPTAASTNFTAASVENGSEATATFSVTVTDSTGSTATDQVVATARNLSTA